MNLKTLVISLVSLLVFSSCSSSRYGYMPKGKRQKTVTKRESKREHKQKLDVVTLKNKKNSYVIPKGISSPHVIELEKPLLPKQVVNEKRITNKQKQTVRAKPQAKKKVNSTNKKSATNKLQKTNDYDFWESWLGEVAFLIIELVIGGLLIVFFGWLVSIGLGWLVYLIAAVVLILIIVWLVKGLNDIFDYIFK